MRRPLRPWEWACLAAITIGAGALRLVHLGRVSPDPFYDAAVRSMTASVHNFFFGAFEPGGSVSIDKPPVDLWLQVASVKLLGFSSTTLKLPEALAGTASVPLLAVTVRRMWSPAAGLAAAAAMAVLPVEVITARSDTMDAVMMLLLVLALAMLVRACEDGGTRWLVAAAVALGLAFNVKLLETVVALPGLAVFAYLCLPGSRRRRMLKLGVAGLAYVVVALSWLTATLIVPAGERPWAIGSTNGSAWNAAFVFNGSDRLGSKSTEPTGSEFLPGHSYPVATQEERDHIPILPPSPTRLLARYGPLSGQRLGLELLIALLLGVPALIWGVLRDSADEDGEPAGLRRRMRRASAAGLTLWMLSGIILFSHMIRLHPRYVEGFTPVVAAMLGIGLAWAITPLGRLRAVVLCVGILAAVYYSELLLYGTPSIWLLSLAGGLAALILAAAAHMRRAGRLPVLATSAAAVASLVAILAVPLKADITAIKDSVTDAGYVGGLPGNELNPLSSYLRAHQGSARYEVAAESATSIGALIVRDDRPVLVLTTYNAQVFTTVAKLRQLIAQGEVRYAFLNSYCGTTYASTNPACSAPARWIRAHGRNVSRQAGLPHDKTLYLLAGATP